MQCCWWTCCVIEVYFHSNKMFWQSVTFHGWSNAEKQLSDNLCAVSLSLSSTQTPFSTDKQAHMKKQWWPLINVMSELTTWIKEGFSLFPHSIFHTLSKTSVDHSGILGASCFLERATSMCLTFKQWINSKNVNLIYKLELCKAAEKTDPNGIVILNLKINCINTIPAK